MLSPVAVSWMVGKSMLEQRFGPVANLGRFLGWETPTFFSSPEIARLTMMCNGCLDLYSSNDYNVVSRTTSFTERSSRSSKSRWS